MRGGFWAVLIVLAGSISVPVARGQDEPVERPRLEGYVVNERTEPIQGADVYWCPTEAFLEMRDDSVHVATDDQGKFRFEAPTNFRVSMNQQRIGRLWVIAKDHGMEVVPASDFRVQAGKSEKRNVGLSPAVAFTLRVVDPVKRAREGELVEPVHIVVREPGLKGFDRLQTGLPRLVRERLAGITDANGEYRVDYLKRGGSIGFRVVSETYGIQSEGGAEERGAVPVVTFRLHPTARVEGSTLGENKKAFAGMRLSVMTFDREVPDQKPEEATRVTFHASVVVREDGSFEVPAIGPGQLRVTRERIYAPWERGGGGGPTIDPVITAPPSVAAGTTASVTLAPEAMTVFRGVVVTEGTNEPVANAFVTLSGRKGRIQASAQTDAQGQYSISSVAVDSVLTASAKVVQSRDVVEARSSPGLKEVVCPPIKLPPTRTIAGRVVNSSGQPVVDAEVIGLEVAIHHGSATTSKDGRFEMLTAAERTITDYVVKLNSESRSVTIRSRDPLELVLNEAEKKP